MLRYGIDDIRKVDVSAARIPQSVKRGALMFLGTGVLSARPGDELRDAETEVSATSKPAARLPETHC
jgi:hypothetical protein